jgi:hypothetical protein
MVVTNGSVASFVICVRSSGALSAFFRFSVSLAKASVNGCLKLVMEGTVAQILALKP